MKLTQPLLLSAALLTAPLAFAQDTEASPKASTESPTESPTESLIEVQFRGTLRDVLEEIAEAGNLNVVITGDLDTPADIRLKGVSAEQALRTVARAHELVLEHDGDIYTLRPMTGMERRLQEHGERTRPSTPAAPSTPAIPPTPAMSEASGNEDASQYALDEQELRERVRSQMRKARGSTHGSQDVVARGRSLEVTRDETVDSAVVYGGTLRIDGHVNDDAVVFGGDLLISGHVEGDAHAFGGNVVLGPEAVVEGDVSAFGGSVTKKDGASVEGRVESFGGSNIGRMVASELKNRPEEDGEKTGSRLASLLISFSLLFGMGFLGQLFFPARMKALGAEIRAQPVRSGLMGLLGAIAVVPAAVVLCLTLIGIPLALALLMVVPVLTGWGFAAVASELGARLPLPGGAKTQALVLALGLFILLVVGRIPVLGVLVLVAATLVGLGAVISTRFGQRAPQGFPERFSESSFSPRGPL